MSPLAAAPPAETCAVEGHEWGDGACTRCGKSSALPHGELCRHGAPLHWRPPHDCDYADAREALVPYAEAAADRDVPRPRSVSRVALERATPAVRGILDAESENYATAWNRAFHRHMALLGAAAARLGRRP